MNKRLMLLLLVSLLLIGGSVGCALSDTLSRRLGSAPQPTEAHVARTPRPTFTATPNWTPTPTDTATPTATLIPTVTLIPSDTPIPTDTPTPLPTETPKPRPKPPTDTPGPPTATPLPEYPFMVAEVSPPDLTKTTNTSIIVFVAITDQNNTPLGGYKLVGDSPQVEFNSHVESVPSCFDWCAGTGKGGYAKVANLKFEPGAFIDGAWNVYLADSGGAQVSPVVALNYGTDPGAWRWDFIAFKLK